MSQPPSQAAVAAAQIYEEFLAGHNPRTPKDVLVSRVQEIISATDRAGWQGIKPALREVELFTRHDEDCKHNALVASVRRCTCGRDAAWKALLEATAPPSAPSPTKPI